MVKSVSNRERIGILGGTFDPVHNTHVAMARTAVQQAKLDTVFFMVAAAPPHKNGYVSADPEDRFVMVAAALEQEEHMQPSRIEIDRPGPSYTADTLYELQQQHPHAQLFLIVGSDSLADLHRWRNPKGILERARLLVIPRPNHTSIPKALENQYDTLKFQGSDISSTRVRELLARGESVDSLLPPAVERYIKEKGLYACLR